MTQPNTSGLMYNTGHPVAVYSQVMTFITQSFIHSRYLHSGPSRNLPEPPVLPRPKINDFRSW